MDNEIVSFLIRHDITPNLRGFNYLVSAIALAFKADNLMPIGALYREVAQQYVTSWSSIERCIRNCLEQAFPRGYKPSNGEFIARAVVYLKYSANVKE